MRYAWMILAGVAVGLWPANGWAESGQAVLTATAEGTSVGGVAELRDTPEGLAVAVRVTGLAQGQYAMHVHQYGECGNTGNDAGGHFNPDGAPHGFLPKDGLAKAHPGDLGNVEVGADGSGSLELVLPGVALTSSAYAVAGRAIILHEKTDDFGQPTGNAGGRIACGPIVLVKPAASP